MPTLSRRTLLSAAAGMALATPARAAARFEPAPGLVEAANKEGRMVFYTASLAEVEQEVINAFNKRFPGVKIELLRASGGQLITRIKTEAATGKLIADVVDHSDRGSMLEIADLFSDYAPPNASEYRSDAQASRKLWPRIMASWTITYNTALIDKAPTSWWDVTGPGFKPGQIGEVIAGSGGTTWTRVMFERQVLGEDYWAKQAATKPMLQVSNGPLSDAVVRGEVSICPVLLNAVLPKMRDGAPIGIVFPKEGVPVSPYAAGIPKTAPHPNAARLFLDWSLSAEGQEFVSRDQGSLSALKVPPYVPEGLDLKTTKLWLPENAGYVALHDKWIAEWNAIYGYRQ